MLKKNGEEKAVTSVKSHDQRLWQVASLWAASFSYGESPRSPPLEGTSLHRWNNSVERPWGILSLFTTCSQVHHPTTVCDTCGLRPKQHTKKRGVLGNTKKTKITRRRAGTWVQEVYEKDTKRKHLEWKKPYEMLNGTKPLSNNNSWDNNSWA